MVLRRSALLKGGTSVLYLPGFWTRSNEACSCTIRLPIWLDTGLARFRQDQDVGAYQAALDGHYNLVDPDRSSYALLPAT